MGKIRNFLRWFFVVVCVGSLLAIICAIVAAFFIEVAREKGYYSNPSQRLDEAVIAFNSFVTQTWFLVVAAGSTGLAIGAWLDNVLRLERRSQATHLLVLDDLYAEGIDERNRLGPVLKDFDAAVENDKLTDWDQRVINALTPVSIQGRHWFRTLDRYNPVFTQQEGKLPEQNRFESLWAEKASRLRQIIRQTRE